MKQKSLKVSIIAAIFLCSVNLAEGVGGRGGGGYHGEESHQEQPHYQSQPHYQEQPHYQSQPHYQEQHTQQLEHHDYNYSSPSMSRADVRPNENTQSHYSQSFNSTAHPSQNQVQQFMQQKPGQVSPQVNQSAFQGQFQKYIQPNSTQITNRPNVNQQQSLKNTLPRLNQANAQTAANTTAQFQQQHPDASNWFNSGFFAQHHYNPNYYSPNGNWWRSEGWAATASWAGLAAATGGYAANYYDDSGLYTNLSPQEATTYSPPQQNIYVNDQPTQTDSQFLTSQQVSSQSPMQNQGAWLPLGVFAIGSTAEQAPYSNMVIQLALSKEGDISGTYYNAATDQTYQIEGMVDRDSQKAVWKLSNHPESPIATTGLYNLTQDVANIQVHFPNGMDQTKVLVRLKNSSG